MKTTSRSILKIVAAVAIGAGLLLAGIAIGRASWGITGAIWGGRYPLGMVRSVFEIGSGGILAILPAILLWGLIIGALVWLVSSLVSRTAKNVPSSTPTPPESALDILKNRYARGEIAKEQYEDMRRDLGV
jgi:putative membrane protein